MSTTLVHVGVRSSNLKESIRFWRDALGLQVVQQEDDYYDLTDSYHNFRVFQHSGPPRPQHVGGMLDYLHIGVRVPDVWEAAKRCESLGFQIIWEGLDGSNRPDDPNLPPPKAFKVEDPDTIVVDVTVDDDQWPGVPHREEDRWIRNSLS